DRAWSVEQMAEGHAAGTREREGAEYGCSEGSTLAIVAGRRLGAGLGGERPITRSHARAARAGGRQPRRSGSRGCSGPFFSFLGGGRGGPSSWAAASGGRRPPKRSCSASTAADTRRGLAFSSG